MVDLAVSGPARAPVAVAGGDSRVAGNGSGLAAHWWLCFSWSRYWRRCSPRMIRSNRICCRRNCRRPGCRAAKQRFPLGTDSLGRCVLSRLMYAARTAVAVALIAASLAAIIGIAFGLIAGMFGGWIDQGVSRLIDVWMAFPPVLLSIVLAAVIGAGLTSVIAAIVVVDWTRFARVVRAETMVQLQRDYAAAARALGLSRGQILRLEILPNLIPLIVTLFAVEMGIAILVEVILSFVGISVAGDVATWGGMIVEGRQVVYQAPWIMALPIGCVILSVIGFNLLGDGLRAALDPVQRR